MRLYLRCLLHLWHRQTAVAAISCRPPVSLLWLLYTACCWRLHAENQRSLRYQKSEWVNAAVRVLTCRCVLHLWLQLIPGKSRHSHRALHLVRIWQRSDWQQWVDAFYYRTKLELCREVLLFWDHGDMAALISSSCSEPASQSSDSEEDSWSGEDDSEFFSRLLFISQAQRRRQVYQDMLSSKVVALRAQRRRRLLPKKRK